MHKKNKSPISSLIKCWQPPWSFRFSFVKHMGAAQVKCCSFGNIVKNTQVRWPTVVPWVMTKLQNCKYKDWREIPLLFQPLVSSHVRKKRFRGLTWPLMSVSFLCLEKLLSCFCSIFLGHYPFALWRPSYCISFAAFDWIWLGSPAPYTSEFVLPASAVTSSINTSDPAPLTAMLLVKFLLSVWYIYFFILAWGCLYLYWHLFGLQAESLNANLKFRINSRSFICLICYKIMREQAEYCLWGQLYKYFWGSENYYVWQD